jgi:two-component system phosphate regulon sensor histidine kinase PhoR
MVVDHDHRIRLVNDSFCRLFLLKADPRGQTILSAVRESSIEELIRATLETGEAQTREISPPYQPQCHFAASAVPLRETGGEISGVVSVFHDISRLRQLEEVRREFIANVSHELRTPLSIFHGYLENLLDNPGMPREDMEGILAVMRKHSLRLNALLEDLLTIARLESRREKLNVSEFDAELFIQQILKDWRLKLTERKITANVRVDSGVPLLHADAFRMEQVFNNLLENAIKFSPVGGEIAITVKAEGTGLVIRVSDKGVGIPPADLPHVFEQFYRVEKARSREAGGTGLGLSIVKHIVALHGGTVEAESVVCEGTAIILHLPGPQ